MNFQEENENIKNDIEINLLHSAEAAADYPANIATAVG